jgi:hypothetical protein
LIPAEATAAVSTCRTRPARLRSRL